ncbi:MAG: thioredoxin family protein [Verrucomicrobiaceae bacterium]|nr:MAG: thioredoxin family protein [Verrucomicrobiaceae bacterium]
MRNGACRRGKGEGEEPARLQSSPDGSKAGIKPLPIMKKSIFCVLLAGSFLINPLHADYRKWVNTEGATIEGELVKVDGDQVTLRLRNGKTSTFAQSKLSGADQEFLKSQAGKPEAVETEGTPVVAANRKAKWLTKMDKAQEQSKETGLPILVLFTGTSWCPYCVKLEKEVFSESAFKSFADQNLVLLTLDFGPGGTPGNKKDEKLQKEYGVKGFPTYFLTDSTGKQLAKGGYHAGINPEVFAKWAEDASPKNK